MQLRRSGDDTGFVRVHGIGDSGEHVGVLRGGIASFGGVVAEVEEARRFVRLRFRLAIAILRLEVRLPLAKAAGESTR